MSLVSFERIPVVSSYEVPPGMSQYDDVWGFFIFTQNVENIYNDVNQYASQIEYTISGAFTCDAENGIDNSIINDEVVDYPKAFRAITTRYNALQALFASKATSQQPDDPSLWYGEHDPRCIALPDPLRDANNNVIYALPSSISIEAGNFGHFIKYQATLAGGQMPDALLVINDMPINGGQIQMSGHHPNIVRHQLISAEGSLMHVKNYSPPRVSISGAIPHGDNENIIGSQAKIFAQSLMSGTMKVDLQRWTSDGLVLQRLFSNLIIDVPSIEIKPYDTMTQFTVGGII